MLFISDTNLDVHYNTTFIEAEKITRDFLFYYSFGWDFFRAFFGWVPRSRWIEDVGRMLSLWVPTVLPTVYITDWGSMLKQHSSYQPSNFCFVIFLSLTMVFFVFGGYWHCLCIYKAPKKFNVGRLMLCCVLIM